MDNEHCRFCGKELNTTMIDLGLSPLSNEYITVQDIYRGQYFYPLVVHVCPECFLAQAAVYQQPKQIFGEYQYFSSYSSSWLKHCKNYVDMIISRLKLNESNHVLEIACNDGYLLQYFLPYHIPVKGIDPAENVIAEAAKKGIEVECGFFHLQTAQNMAQRGESYDLIVGNNVLAHVPDIKNFVSGLPCVLKENGTVTMEFPHLLQLIDQCQFDTIYHEHFSYLSLCTVDKIFRSAGLEIYHVEQIPTHGGSLRIFAKHISNHMISVENSVAALLKEEIQYGLTDLNIYREFQKQVSKVKYDALQFLCQQKLQGKRIAAFGAAAKGNTFLNYCGIHKDIVDFVVDSNVHKQGYYLPGSLIPIVGPEVLKSYKPDYVIILPWNLREEIVQIAGYIREWNGKFITFIPEMDVF